MIIKRFLQLNEKLESDSIKEIISQKEYLYDKIFNYIRFHLDDYKFEDEDDEDIIFDHIGDIWLHNKLSSGELNIQFVDEDDNGGDLYEFNGEEYQTLLKGINLTKVEVEEIITNYDNLLRDITKYLIDIKRIKKDVYVDYAYIDENNMLNILHLDQNESGDYYKLSIEEYSNLLLYINTNKFNL